MTQEDKELLLKDLCARLPYSVKCEIDDIDEPLELESIKFKGDYFIFGNGVYERYITEIKPYLRPMSSMTEEECKTLGNIPATLENSLIEVLPNIPYYIEVAVPDQIDWLNKNGFDYRGLIEKGLALPATQDMY